MRITWKSKIQITIAIILTNLYLKLGSLYKKYVFNVFLNEFIVHIAVICRHNIPKLWEQLIEMFYHQDLTSQHLDDPILQ